MSRDATPEEIKAAEAIKENEVLKISNVFNLNQICRIKARAGLWAMITQKNKSGMIGFKSLSEEKRIFDHIDKCEPLGSFIIHNNKAPHLDLGGLLDNMFDLKTEQDDYFEQKATSLWFMDKVAPDYDPDKFKTYHYEKIEKWFAILWDSLENNDK